MATLKYLGTPAQWDIQHNFQFDPATLSYINLLLSQNMTMPQVTALITAGLSQYSTQSQATTAMSVLATPAYTNTQLANYVPVSTVNQANGPVGLDSTTGLISKGLINAASTQQWPEPFWSPANYQSAAVTASAAAAQLFTVAIPDPGYTYVLACLGAIDGRTAADNGSFPQVLVRVGSATGQIIAFGYGCGESYQGPIPGNFASQAIITQTSQASGSFAAIPNWTAVNNSSFTTSMTSNFLQIPETVAGTLSASVVFGGGTMVTGTGIRLVDSTGAILATGASVTGNSGTATVTATGNFTAGTLYTVQGKEAISTGIFGIGTEGNWQSGTLTFEPGQVAMTAPVSIIPVPFEDQTPLTGASTLFVMLQSSDSTTAVTASTFDPGLWIMPIPWA